jgi:Ca-activated chloride channel family protein
MVWVDTVMRSHRCFLLASILLAWPASAASLKRIAPDAGFRVDTSLVLVNVGVTDERNGMVGGLKREDFQVFENGARQKIAYFTSEDSPLSVGLVFDSSNSMTDKITAARQAAALFLQYANPDDEVFLETFNDRVKVALDFTDHYQEVQNLAAFQTPQGRTSLLDAVYLALRHIQKAANRRRALLLITDGADNASRYTAREVADLARESDVAIYAIGTFEPATEGPEDLLDTAARNLLQELTSISGGRLFPVSYSSDLPSCAEKIAAELHNQYVLAYYPTAVRGDGKYHRLNVKVRRPGEPRLWPTARPGYYAPSR